MKKTLEGIVVSTKMDKTVVVSVERSYRHPLYQKVVKRHKRFQAHNEMEGIVEGDTVKITETRPISKNKYFEVVEKITK